MPLEGMHKGVYMRLITRTSLFITTALIFCQAILQSGNMGVILKIIIGILQ